MEIGSGSAAPWAGTEHTAPKDKLAARSVVPSRKAVQADLICCLTARLFLARDLLRPLNDARGLVSNGMGLEKKPVEVLTIPALAKKSSYPLSRMEVDVLP